MGQYALRLRWAFATFAFIAATLAASPVAWGYIETVTPSGTPVKWPQGFKLNLAGNPTNQSGLSDRQVRDAVVRGLQRWQAASGGAVQFDYWQGTDTNVYEPDSDYNGLSSIYFASNARVDPGVSNNVLGLTQVWYNADSGEIVESDTVLNDRDFTFTTDPRDTSGYGSSVADTGGYIPGRIRVYIENVITHELGHAFGLSHSDGLQSTMLFMESPEQAHLSCDELVGIRALYPSSDAGMRGRLSGRVVAQNGGAIFGAHVLAISRSRGVALSGGITDRNGDFSIGGLEAGTYFLMAEPYYAGAQALPQYFASETPDICGGGNAFHRTVLTEPSGVIPVGVDVPAGGQASAPPIEVLCQSSEIASSMSGVAGAGEPIGHIDSSSIASAPVVYSGQGPGFGAVDTLSSGTRYFQLQGATGYLEIHALSYSLYSPTRAQVDLVDSSGRSVGAQVTSSVYQGDSGYVNYDTMLTADVPPGDYFVSVSSSNLNIADYPAGPVMIDSNPFVVVTGTVNQARPPLANVLPNNARCRMDENFAAYLDPPGNPPRADVNSDDGHTGFCGTISPYGYGGGRSGPGLGAAIGWLLPWAFMGLAIPITRRRRAPNA